MGSSEVAAGMLFLAIWLLPFFVREFRNSAQMMFAYWFVIILHQAVAFTNAFWFTTLGADTDAATFHRIGAELAQSGNFSFAFGSKFYESALGVVYWLLGSSHLLGEQLSILAFAASCIVLIKILRLLGPPFHDVVVLLTFGALPTMVLLGSVTLRESCQILFFMLAVYFGIRMHIKGGMNIYLIALAISVLVMGLFHKALVIYAICLIFLFLVWSYRPVSGLWSIKKLRLIAIVALPSIVGGTIILAKMQIPGLSALTALVDMNLLEAASNYREISVVSRATYGVSLDLSSPLMAIYTSFVLYINYLFAPFPWRVRNILDVYAFMESVLRIALIYYSVRRWRTAGGAQRRLLGLMLILFFSMSFMWAMGTTNYGTAMRHHMLSWWILVIVGLPLLMEKLKHALFGVTLHGRRHALEKIE